MKKKKKNQVKSAEETTTSKLSTSELENFANILSAYADDTAPDGHEEIIEAEVGDTAETVVSDGETDIPEVEDTEAEKADPDSAEEIGEMTPFEESLKNFKASDWAEKKKSFSISSLIRLVVLILCGAICAVSTVTLVRNITDKIRGEKIYGDIIDEFADGFNFDGNVANDGGRVDLLGTDIHANYTPPMGDIIQNGITEDSTPANYSAELARMRASLESLRNINPEIYGWIKVPGTKINYPIAQTSNNEYYLDHAYTGDNLVNGSIFADFRCDPLVMMNYNTVFYGHNVNDGSMFNHVVKFYDEEFFNSTLVYVYTFSGIYIYKPFSIHEPDYDSGYIRVGFTADEFISFATDLKNQSAIASDKTFTENDRIITLSTCTNGARTKRNALHAYLVQKITD